MTVTSAEQLLSRRFKSATHPQHPGEVPWFSESPACHKAAPVRQSQQVRRWSTLRCKATPRPPFIWPRTQNWLLEEPLGYYWAIGDPPRVLTLDSSRLAAAIPIGTGWLLGACIGRVASRICKLRTMNRSENMRAVRGKDTGPEKTVRSMLHHCGYRFRLHRSDLPGKPDLVFPSLRKVIFVHGCFWHSHDCRKGKGAPSTNSEFWKRKRELTVERDSRTLKALAECGWDAYVVWECALKEPDALKSHLKRFLSRTPRSDRKSPLANSTVN